MRRALAALALPVGLALVVACRSEISLGTPDAGPVGPDSGPTPVPPRCPGIPSRAVVADADPALGELRGVAARGDVLYALLARAGSNEGVLARVATSGGTLTELARVGSDPAGLAISPDGAYVFVAARGSSQIFRVDRNGTATVVSAGGAPSSVIADDEAGAFWSVPVNDAVLRWDFVTPPPQAVATSARAASLARANRVLYIAGDRAIRAFTPGLDAAPRQLAAHCDDGAPAIAGSLAYCVEAEAITRVDLATGDATIMAAAQPGATNVVVAAGRVLWRARPSDRQTLVMALPLDGIGGATVFESSGPGALIMAANGCDLYFSAGRAIVRRGL